MRLLLSLILCSFASLESYESITRVQDRYKLYCLYTPEFKTLYTDYFLPSLKDDFEVIVRKYPQDCPSGVFGSDGWQETMLHKLELLIEAIQENWNDQIFVYSDIDIIFLRPILESVLTHLGNNDFVVQQGWPKNQLCAGFFVMKGNEKTLKLITKAYDLLNKRVCFDDQDAIRVVLSRFKRGEIAWKFLPAEQFPNGRRVLKDISQRYTPGCEIIIDDAIKLFHANCCVGLDNKYHFLEQVQAEFSKNQVTE